MPENPVQQGNTFLDQMFFVPSGVLDMESTTQTVRVNPNSSEEYDYSGEDGGAGIDMESIESGPEGVDDDGGVPREEMATPLVTGIISQTIRTSPGGNQVVDIVIEVEDIPGAINYDYRIAKVG